ncbi:hypothetical protein [Sphingomonas bacterium]|uniref:hypothetical protein n=1 Tax=Sphingomonas bacterium TaxID=1895847 RepID=UPI001576BDC4|nr:hypothetical protein [Sphingomonas bacterium]
MIIDNGRQVRLVIDGVFDGLAGLSRGKVAFVPNKSGKPPEQAVAGIIDDEPVRLVIAIEGKGPFYAGRVHSL